MEIKKSKIHGYGLFATRKYAPGERLYLNSKQIWIMNHSCNPTCRIVRDIINNKLVGYFHAGVRGIKKGEEITADYRKEGYYKSWKRNIGNNCNCKTCREKS